MYSSFFTAGNTNTTKAHSLIQRTEKPAPLSAPPSTVKPPESNNSEVTNAASDPTAVEAHQNPPKPMP
jgi:hypothetical protein